MPDTKREPGIYVETKTAGPTALRPVGWTEPVPRWALNPLRGAPMAYKRTLRRRERRRKRRERRERQGAMAAAYYRTRLETGDTTAALVQMWVVGKIMDRPAPIVAITDT